MVFVLEKEYIFRPASRQIVSYGLFQSIYPCSKFSFCSLLDFKAQTSEIKFSNAVLDYDYVGS